MSREPSLLSTTGTKYMYRVAAKGIAVHHDYISSVWSFGTICSFHLHHIHISALRYSTCTSSYNPFRHMNWLRLRKSHAVISLVYSLFPKNVRIHMRHLLPSFTTNTPFVTSCLFFTTLSQPVKVSTLNGELAPVITYKVTGYTCQSCYRF